MKTTTWKSGIVVVLASLVTAGCSMDNVQRGWLPGNSDQEVTNHTGRIVNLWNGTWIAALIVGVIVWGLILWCMAVYRRRRQDEGLPRQIRYHVPIEMLFTVTPILMVLTLFYFTARDSSIVADASGEPDVQIEVVGKQWAWDYNYLSDNVYDSTEQVDLTGVGADLATQDIPTLYLPVDQNVEIILQSRDVAHSFWVPAFLFKQDLLPGRTNVFQVTPTREGVYAGKCAELCGEFHSEMVFKVNVVSQAEYDAHMDSLEAAGNTGSLPVDLGRSELQPGMARTEGDN